MGRNYFALIFVLICLFPFSSSYGKSPIKYVVVLMLENHSFDNYFGFLEGFGDLTGKEYNLMDPSDHKSKKIYVKKGADYCTVPDPPHDFISVGHSIYAPFEPPLHYHPNNSVPTMGGFVQAYLHIDKKASPENVMSIYTADQIPVLTTLCQEFKCCTNFYSSLPGPTGPNRLFVHSGGSNGYSAGNYTNPPVKMRTVFEQLIENDPSYSFAIHFHDFETSHGIYPLNEKYKNYFVQDLGFQKFMYDVDTGNLKNYTFLTPLLGPLDGMWPTTQHPSFDIRPAEHMVKQLYERIRASAYWEEILFVITFDEHGGFYDSKHPPVGVPRPSNMDISHPYDFDFTRLGVRIPTIFVSPWMEKKADPTLYDLTSIPETIRRIFQLNEAPLTNRSAAANSFDQFLTTPRTDCPTTLPSPPNHPPLCKPNEDSGYTGLAAEYIAMYKKLLIAHKINLPLDNVKSDSDATLWMMNAIDLLSKAPPLEL